MTQTQSLQVICPACEQTISDLTSEDASTQVERPCPSCGYRFVWSGQIQGARESIDLPWRGLVNRLPMPKAVVDHAARRVSSDSHLPPVLAPLRAASRRPISPTPPDIVPPTAAPPRLAPSRSVAPPAELEKELLDEPEIRLEEPWQKPVATIQSRSTSQATSEQTATAPAPRSVFKSAWLWIVAGVALVGCLVVVLIAVLAPPAGTPSESATPNASAQPDHATAAEASASATRSLWPTELNSEPSDLWNHIGAYSVGVEFGSSESKRRVSGVLIDTRGWLLLPGLTNEQLASAEIIVGPSSPFSGASVRMPIKSLVGRLDEPSLVVVQVDANPFRAFADLAFDAPSENSTTLIVAGWNNDSQWLTPLSATRSNANLDLPLDETDGLSLSLIGGLVLDDEEHVLGVMAPSTATEPWKQGRIIGRETLMNWLAQVQTDPKEEMLVATAAATTTATPDNPAPLLPPRTTPVAEPNAAEWARAEGIDPLNLNSLVRMEEISTILLAAHGRIDNETNYRRAAELAKRIYEIESHETAPNVEAGLRRLLNDGGVAIRETWQRVAWPDEESIAKTNELAISQVDNFAGFWGYGEVVEAAGVAPRIDEGDTVLLQLIGTDHRIAVPVSKAFDELSVGTRWLVWGSAEPRLNLTEAVGGTASGTPVIRSLWLMEEPEVLIPGRPLR